MLCRVLEVTRAAYYQSRGKKISKTQSRQLEILAAIEKVRQGWRECYGSPRVHQELIRQGIQCCRNTVAKLMRIAGIRARHRKKFTISTTDSNHAHPVAPNRLEQQFTVDSTNQVWLTDITYIPTREGFTYLCTVEDLCSRRIVGWATSQSIDTSLVLAAFDQAAALRSPAEGLVVHSDRGSQYASEAFRGRLQLRGYLQSMSGKGNCYDNAPMEAFFKSFKSEQVKDEVYETHEQATRAAADYIERFYNRSRLHSSLGYLSPIEFEIENA